MSHDVFIQSWLASIKMGYLYIYINALITMHICAFVFYFRDQLPDA